MVLQDGSWPVWAGNGVGFRRTRLVSYAIVAACLVFAAYFFVSWESIPSLEQLKSQYCDSSPPETAAALPLNNAVEAGSSGPSTEELQAKIAALEKTISDKDGAINDLTSKLKPQAPPLPQHKEACIDPYRRPGYLYIDNSTGDYNTTRWIPYTPAFLDAEDPISAAYPYNATEKGEIFFEATSAPEASYLDHPLTPTNWMDLAVKESLRRKQGEPMNEQLSWLYGRVVLLIGDSVDRYNMQWFCYEFSSRNQDEDAKFHENGVHATATCRVPSLNMTIVHWHMAGMTTYPPLWWWDAINIKHVPFEERYDYVWSKTFGNITSVNGKGPDLIIWQSALWDRKNWLGTANTHYGKEHWMTTYTRGLVWDEVRFYTARAKTLIEFIKEKVGADVPFMLRTVTIDRDIMARDVQLYDMDRLNRVIGERYGIEAFEWGHLIAGHAELYRDGMHPGRGPSSWLYGTMVLEYLARAVGAGTAGGARAERAPYFDGWDQCHNELVPIGGNAYH